jgi:hypothetical protein
MAEETAVLSRERPKFSAIDIFKNVTTALVIALLAYWLPLMGERLFFSSVEVSYQQFTVLERQGYLFTTDNYSSRPLESISIYLATNDARVSSYVGTTSLELKNGSTSSVVKLTDIPPQTRATVFVESAAKLTSDQVRISSTATVTTAKNATASERRWWDVGTFFWAIFVALAYLSFAIWMTSQIKKLEVAIDDTTKKSKEFHDKAARIQHELEAELKNVELRQQRVKIYLQRRITELDKETAFWRRFFRTLYTTIFGDKSDAGRALQLILANSGVPLVKKLADYSEGELVELLELSAENRSLKSTPQSQT